MAALNAFLDDSGDETNRDCTAVALAGYIGSGEAWDVFERNWGGVLAKYGVPWLHMEKFAHSQGPFKPWRGDERRRRAFLQELCATIAGAHLHGIGAVVSLSDLARFNADHGTRIEPMPLAIYMTMLEIYLRDPNQWVKMRIDRMKRCNSKLETAIGYARAFRGDDVSHIISAHCEKRSADDRPPLQAADYAAYEALKFERTRPRVAPPDGKPQRRGSFNALLDAAPLVGMVVDYDTLRQIHEWRHGVWTSRPAA